MTEYFYKTCKTHGPLTNDLIIVRKQIKKSNVSFCLTCIYCIQQWKCNKSSDEMKNKRIANNEKIKCILCKKLLSFSSFTPYSLRSYYPKCARCHNANNQKYKDKKSVTKSCVLNREDYNDMLFKQNHRCAICKSIETAILHGKPKNLAVDHCHNTYKIRGLLCQRCNQALGLMNDNPFILRTAAEYLENS